ncbi:MAG TPA: PAS domain S-box protein [Candidatus Sulfotelmatobacter sp.]|nr:PAS domain S-box protein [Candidatus Sulfotelmatobacter sp.]
MNSETSVSPLLLSAEFLEFIPDAIVAVDQSGTIIHVNSQTLQMFGYGRDELIGQKIETLVPERHRAQHHGHRQEFAKRPKIRSMGAGLDLRGKRRDGSEFPVEISLSPVQTEQGMLVLSAIRDVSDRKRMEDELRKAHQELSERTDRELWESRSQLEAIVNSSEDAIVGKDLDGIVTSWNKGAEHMYGYTAQEIVGQSISLLAPSNRPDEIPSILEKIKQGERFEHYETLRIAKDGRPLQVSVSISPIRDSSGTVIGASAIARDITLQKRSEDQLRQAQKMEAVGRLAGGVAHDFNNVLGIITACTELLRGRQTRPEEIAELVENIRTATHRGATLTRQLLSFSRKQVVQPVVFDLHERVREISKLVGPLMGDDVEVVIHAKSKMTLVEVDPGQFDQIVMNLAVNARDAMPRGGKLIFEASSVQFDSEFVKEHPQVTAGKYIQLSVSDTGFGMDEATVTRIFEPFFTTKELGKGTGLGLATVYGIVRQAGGYIWVYSEPNRGTTFKLYLPSAEHKLGAAADLETEVAVPASRGQTILLVEDDKIMRGLTRQMLQEHGYTVIEAEDGESALKLAEAAPRIDLVLTDVVMHGLSGPELGSRLASLNPAVKILYMSGYSGELFEKNGGAHPAAALLEKPFSRRALLTAVDVAMS